ncbi:MAG: SDR family NAD(P)-dependent oxidoreductase [Hyphomicrobiales bacterium]
MAEHQNRVAIVTGGAQGIGYAICERLLHDGARVVIADINDDLASEAVETLGEYGPIRYVHCNVAERLDVHNLVASTLDAYGDIDILVNNAGVVHGASFLEITEEDFDRVMDINLKGSFLVSQAVAKHMVERAEAGSKPGSIVNMSSINSVVAIENQIPYSVSKGGVNQLTKVASLALAKHGIRVNAVGPGSIMTPMLDAVNHDPAARARMLSRTPASRLGDPKEIASVVSFLASDDASYITGQTIYADGGRLGLNYVVPVPDEA